MMDRYLYYEWDILFWFIHPVNQRPGNLGCNLIVRHSESHFLAIQFFGNEMQQLMVNTVDVMSVHPGISYTTGGDLRE
jgi:hypothetical protein